MFNRPNNRWWSVFGGFFSLTVSAAVVGIYAFGVFAKALGAEYGWSRAEVSLGLTCFAVFAGLGQLLFGAAMDRFGVRPLTIVGVVLFGAGFAAVPFLPPHQIYYLGALSVAGFFSAAATIMPYAFVIRAWFDRHRGLALGIVNMGAGAGAAVMPLFASWLLAKQGWRVGYWGVATLATIVATFMLVVFIRLPRETVARRTATPDAQAGDTLRFILGNSGAFWLIALAIFSVSVSTFGLLPQLIALGTDRGLSPMAAAGVLSAAGTASFCSRVIVGFLLDRFFAPYVAAGVLAVTAAGMGLIIGTHSPALLTTAAAFLGISIGSEADLISYLSSRYFSMAAFGRVLGVMFVAWSWGGALGTYLLALCFDHLHSYDSAIGACIVLLAISIVALLRLGPYVYPPEAHRAATR